MRTACRFFAFLALLIGCAEHRQTTTVGPASTVSYVLSSSKPAAGFGPVLQPYSGLHWTYFGISILRAVGAPVPNREATGSALLREDPGDPLSERFHQRALALTMLGMAPDSGLASRLQAQQGPDGGWQGDLTRTFRAVDLLSEFGTQPIAPASAAQFVADRLNSEGWFGLSPRAGTLSDSLRIVSSGGDTTTGGASSIAPEEHIWNTFCGVRTLTKLGYRVPWQSRVRSWLQSCQNSDGGFAPFPAARAGAASDVWYSFLAISALRALGSAPSDSNGAVAFINACQNSDGGFADRPGRASRLEATYYAVAALNELCGDVVSGVSEKKRRVPSVGPDRSWGGARISHLFCEWGDLPAPHDSKVRSGIGLPLVRFHREIVQSDTTGIGAASPSWPDPAPTAVWESDPVLLTLELPGAAFVPVEVAFRAEYRARPKLVRLLDAALNKLSTRNRAGTVAWEAYISECGEPMSRAGALATYRLRTGEQGADYLITDLLAEGAPAGTTVAAALCDGVDLMRENPRLERLSGLVPFVVGLSDSVVGNDARVFWLGGGTDFRSLVDALAGGRSVCAVRVPAFPAGVVLYGEPRAVAFLSSRKSEWVWWTGRETPTE